MRIPEIADELVKISDEVSGYIGYRLKYLAGEMARRPPVKRGKRVSTRVTKQLAKEISDFVRKNPDLTQSEVAKRFNVNQGRVSEIIRGFRS